MTKGAFARFIGKSEPTIEKLEARIAPELATQLADIAAEHGYRDLSNEFLAIAAGESTSLTEGAATVTDPLASVTTAERDLLLGLLEISRSPNPRSYLQRVLPGLVRSAMAERRATNK